MLGLPDHPFLRAVIETLIFGLIGILLTVFGFKLFDWMMPKIDVEKELAEQHNVAVAIVMAAVILGISIIIAAVLASPSM